MVHETMSLDCGTLVHEVVGSLPSAVLKSEILFMCLYAGIPICLVDDDLGSEDPFSFSVTSHAVSPLWGSRHRWACPSGRVPTTPAARFSVRISKA